MKTLDAMMAKTLVAEISDYNQLMTALYFSDPGCADYVLKAYSEESMQAHAARMAVALHFNGCLRAIKVENGAFADGLDGLLALVGDNDLLGFCLLPAFEKALEFGTAHGCDKELVQNLALATLALAS